MQFTKMLLTSVLAISTLTISLSGQAQTAPLVGTQGVITHTEVFNRGTPEFEAVRQFIVQHSTREQRQFLDNGSQLPVSFTVSYTTHIRSSADVVRAQDIPSPPMPLPSFGNPGDTISVSSCSGGTQESWSYTWQGPRLGGGWVLDSYSVKRVNSCKSQPIGQQ